MSEVMSTAMSLYFKDLTEEEREAFLTDNIWGTLAFNGDTPYAIPVDYDYRKGTILISLNVPSRKVGYLDKSRKVGYLDRSQKVCFSICRPRWFTPRYSKPCISVIVEGELEEVDDRSYYDLPPISEKNKDIVICYRIREDKMSAKKCIIPPKDCDFFTRQKAHK